MCIPVCNKRKGKLVVVGYMLENQKNLLRILRIKVEKYRHNFEINMLLRSKLFSLVLKILRVFEETMSFGRLFQVFIGLLIKKLFRTNN